MNREVVAETPRFCKAKSAAYANKSLVRHWKYRGTLHPDDHGIPGVPSGLCGIGRSHREVSQSGFGQSLKLRVFAAHLRAKETEHRLAGMAADLKNTDRISDARLNIGRRWPPVLPTTGGQRHHRGLTLQFENTLPSGRHEADQGRARLRRWVLRKEPARCRLIRTTGLGTLQFVS